MQYEVRFIMGLDLLTTLQHTTYEPRPFGLECDVRMSRETRGAVSIFR